MRSDGIIKGVDELFLHFTTEKEWCEKDIHHQLSRSAKIEKGFRVSSTCQTRVLV